MSNTQIQLNETAPVNLSQATIANTSPPQRNSSLGGLANNAASSAASHTLKSVCGKLHLMLNTSMLSSTLAVSLPEGEIAKLPGSSEIFCAASLPSLSHQLGSWAFSSDVYEITSVPTAHADATIGKRLSVATAKSTSQVMSCLLCFRNLVRV